MDVWTPLRFLITQNIKRVSVHSLVTNSENVLKDVSATKLYIAGVQL